MKKFKVFFVFVLIFALSTQGSINVNAGYTEDYAESVDSDFPETIVIDGVEKNVRVVTQEEYDSDESNDFLILISYEDQAYRSGLSIHDYSYTSPKSKIKKVAIWLGEQLIGYALEKGVEYLVTSGVGRAVFTSVVQSVYAAFPYVVLIYMGAVAVYTVYVMATYKVKNLMNSSGCVWNGPSQHVGKWLCPMSLPVEWES